MDLDATELIGYLASALVVASLATTSVVRLRTISLGASAVFVTYGLLIDAIPIVVTNIVIAGLNLWFLSKELGGRRDLGAVVVPPDSPFLVDFLAHHAGDIAGFQPEFDPTLPAGFALVLTRDGLPAGIVLGERDGNRLDITLDYVLKAYRDSRIGAWLFGPGAGVFRSAGIDEVTTAGGTESHRGYLARVGFEYDRQHGRFRRVV